MPWDFFSTIVMAVFFTATPLWGLRKLGWA